MAAYVIAESRSPIHRGSKTIAKWSQPRLLNTVANLSYAVARWKNWRAIGSQASGHHRINESAERAEQWWASEEYREAKALRQRTAQTICS